MQQTFELKASQAASWVRCPSRFTHGLLNPSKGHDFVSVATEFGNRVHTAVTGHEAEVNTKLAWDKVTPTERDLNRQVCQAVSWIKLQLESYKILHRELEIEKTVRLGNADIKVSGHIDLVATDEFGKTHLIDIKTGTLNTKNHMTQQAIYAWLAHKDARKVDYVTLIMAPRYPKVTKKVVSFASEDLIGTVTPLLRMFATGASSPAAIPGSHCMHCLNHECPYNTEEI